MCKEWGVHYRETRSWEARVDSIAIKLNERDLGSKDIFINLCFLPFHWASNTQVKAQCKMENQGNVKNASGKVITFIQ